MTSRWWSLHTHSLFSANDAISSVPSLVERAVELDYPALGLTDHGGVPGNVQLYRAARKVGIEPLPGIELYVSADTEYKLRETSHMTIAAYTSEGYRNLCRIATLSAQKYYFKPTIDLADFAQMAQDGATNGLVIGTGCYFGLIPKIYRTQGEKAARQTLEALAGWFPRTYVEIQNHGICEHNDESDPHGLPDDDMMEAMYDLSVSTGIPPIVTRDSHYTYKKDRPEHEALKELVSFSEDPGEAVFPGGGYFMASEEDMADYIPEHILEAGLDTLTDLASAASVRIPELESFKVIVPDISVGGDAQKELEERVLLAMEARGAKNAHYDLIKEEFAVIRDTESAPYFLFVLMVCDYMREHGIRYTARGSASGSQTCYWTEITQLDPVKYKLRFDRFMSHSRIKPPDIDLDVEHTRRDQVIDFISTGFYVQAVGALRKYTLHGDDEMDPEHEDSKGSLRERYYTVRNKKGEPRIEWGSVPLEDKQMLYSLSDRKLFSGYGRHAAGYIVAPNRQVLDDIPLAYIASSKKMVTAYGKKDIELMGYTKLDLLGLKTQTSIRLMIESSGVDFDNIDLRDGATYRAIGQGRTVGVFQLGGFAMILGCKQMRPRKLEDIIAAQALFRPAARESGATDAFLDRRNKREEIPQRHEDIMMATSDTYGLIIYQEQIMQVMTNLGMDRVELEEMLDAVKASNDYSEGAAVVIEEALPRIRELAVGRGWDKADIDWLVEAIPAFAGYSFNRSHAAAYGLIAYRHAWMRVNMPLDFWTATLAAFQGSDNILKFEREARRDGIRILPANVNISKHTYTLDRERGVIRRGLMSVKGVKSAADSIVAAAPFTSLVDFGQRVPNKVTGSKHLALGRSPEEAGGMVLALFEAGALNGLDE